jgi:hypothetical protein
MRGDVAINNETLLMIHRSNYLCIYIYYIYTVFLIKILHRDGLPRLRPGAKPDLAGRPVLRNVYLAQISAFKIHRIQGGRLPVRKQWNR